MKIGIGLLLLAVASASPYYYAFATYQAGRQYNNGDRVRVGTEVYQCRPPPYNDSCHKDVYSPLGPNRDKVWMKVSATQIKQEQRDFSLPEYTRNFAYKLNEPVQLRGRAYKCVMPSRCGDPDTLPGTAEARAVWIDISTNYKTDSSCRGNSGIDNVAGSSTNNWNNKTHYSFGDRVIHSGRMYQCQSFPNGQFCQDSSFVPGSKKGLLAWEDITCKDLSRESTKGLGTAYTPGQRYQLGDQVHYRGRSYACVGQEYCSLATYHPAVGNAGAWVRIFDTTCPKARPHSLLEAAQTGFVAAPELLVQSF